MVHGVFEDCVFMKEESGREAGVDLLCSVDWYETETVVIHNVPLIYSSELASSLLCRRRMHDRVC